MRAKRQPTLAYRDNARIDGRGTIRWFASERRVPLWNRGQDRNWALFGHLVTVPSHHSGISPELDSTAAAYGVATFHRTRSRDHADIRFLRSLYGRSCRFEIDFTRKTTDP